MEGTVRHEHFIFIRRRHRQMNVVTRAADQRAIPIHHAPIRAAVIRPPHGTLIGGLNQRVNAIGIGGRNRDIDFAERRFRQPRSRDAFPCRAPVARSINAAARASAEFSVGVHLHLPSPREQHAEDSSRPSKVRCSRYFRRRTAPAPNARLRRWCDRRRAPAAARSCVPERTRTRYRDW